MLKKMFGYDFRSMGKPIGLLTVIVMITTVVGTVALRFSDKLKVTESESFNNILSGSATLFVVAAVIAIAAYAVVSVILILRRYYTHLFTDEGYLTFTLPVRPGTIILSKFWSGYIRALICAAVTLMCAFFMFAVGTSKTDFIDANILRAVRKLFDILMDGNDMIWAIELMLIAVTGVACNIMTFFLAITLGSIIAKKHKVLASIGMYYGINLGLALAYNAYAAVLTPMVLSGIDSETAIHFLFSGLTVIILAVAIIVYFINRMLLTKKLNLA